jgi:hypothetical protein
MSRVDAHLLDMGVPIDGIDQHVADRAAGIVDCDPAAPMLGVAGQDVEGWRLVVRDLGQPDVTEPLPGEPLDSSLMAGGRMTTAMRNEVRRGRVGSPPLGSRRTWPIRLSMRCRTLRGRRSWPR